MWILGLLVMIIGSTASEPQPDPSETVDRVAYDGGFLVTDGCYFEGTVSLRFVRDGYVLRRFRGDELIYRSIDGAAWRTDLVHPPRRIRRH